MTKKEKTAIVPTREEDYPEWYQQVIKAADMAENSPVRGCMVIKPWGYGIWENIQKELDKRIKATGHQNAYFPLFIPLSYLEKEAKHVEGFAKECAVITHHRLEEKGGKLVPSGELEEPLIVRPTSEMIIGEAFSRWIESYRDLPMLLNQWANVVRWEMRPRIFLRTAEFLWQEGHTAHETEEEAIEETIKMLLVYREVVEDLLAVPLILGEKSEGERFPGAVNTFTLEAMMQDKKALQGGTSHYLGQNFSKAQGIKFTSRTGELQHAYTTSWGVTTRLIGCLIMVHGDDDGLRLPPRIAPKHVVIIPFLSGSGDDAVLEYAERVAGQIKEQNYYGNPVVVTIDKRDIRGGEKNWEWIKKGVPIRIEVGPKDMESQTVMLARRDKSPRDKEKVGVNEIAQKIPPLLDEIQVNYFQQAKAMRDANIRTDIKNFEELKVFFNETPGGFVLAKWCEDPATEEMLKDLKVTIRCLPLEQREDTGTCILTGKPASRDAIFAKSY